MKGHKWMKWYTQGLRQLLDELTREFNLLSVDKRIELLRLVPEMSIILSRVVRYHETTRSYYENKESKK